MFDVGWLAFHICNLIGRMRGCIRVPKRMKRSKKTPILALVAVSFFPALISAETSQLWGTDGELWDPENSLLRDFSDVGYMQGNVPIPDWPVGVNVTDFGAVADDDIDDSQAFLDAIAACPDNHAVYVPDGTYNIEQQLKVTDKSNFVLRGESMYGTVLWMPYYLTEIPGAENTAFYYLESAAQCGLENLSFIFRDQPKGGHWESLGADAIQYKNVTNSWIRDVYIKNSDHAIGLSSPYTTHVSVLNVVLDQYYNRKDQLGTGADGHMGIAVFDGRYHLIHNVLLTGSWHHDINAQGGKNSVWSRITGPAVGIDHHAMGAVENLWTEIDVGRGKAWNRAGSIRETYWNIRADRDIAYPAPEDRNVIVGGQTSDPTDIGTDYWHETIVPEDLVPENIYLAQMSKAGKPLPVETTLTLPPLEWPYKLVATEDTRVQGGNNSGTNFGWDKNIRLKAGSGGTDRRGFFKFDLGELGLTHVAGAKLRVYVNGLSGPPFGLQVVEVGDSWQEFEVTYDTMPAEGDVITTEMLNGSGWRTLDLTDYVNSQLAGDQVVSFGLKGGAEGHNKDAFTSVMGREGGNSTHLVLYTDAAKADPPSAPTGLTAAPGDGEVRLDWTDGVEADLASYNLYRSSGDNSNYELRAAGLVYSEYRDLTPANGETYHYLVKSVDTGGIESPEGAEVVATPQDPNAGPPAAPSDLTVSVGEDSITLDWADNDEPDLGSYSVYRKLGSGEEYASLADALTESEHIDSTVEGAGLYSYAVTAWDTGGNESVLSQPVAVNWFVDADGDGLDDAWEEDHFLSVDAIDGSLDSDGDGILDFFEFLFGSDPNDSASNGFQLSPLQDSSESGIGFSWSVKEGFLFGSHYGVEMSTDLGTWEPPPVGGFDLEVEPQSGMNQVQFHLSEMIGGRVFLRLVQL